MAKLNRKNMFVSLALILIVLQLTMVLSVNVKVQAASSKTLVVPDNYPSIAAAVGNASQGDTVLVKAGTYYENVAINKSITITGENAVVIGKGGAPNTYVFRFQQTTLRFQDSQLKAPAIQYQRQSCLPAESP